MTRFTGGPADGQVLALKRSPLFLRVTRDRAGTWDALDQLDDSPAPDEELWAYRCLGVEGVVHVNRGRKGSQMFQVARYACVEEQPDAMTIRVQSLWRAWCVQAAGVRTASAGEDATP